MSSIAFWSVLLLAVTTTYGYGICNEFDTCNCFFDELKLVVDCMGRGLDELPEGLPKSVQIIICSDNNFKELPQELKLYTLLEEINFSGNHISSIRADALSGLSALKKLDLSRNNITRLSDINAARILLPAEELVEFNLSYNPISSLPTNNENIIRSNSLYVLSLSGCQIYSFVGKYFFSFMSKLEFLDLSYNPLRMLGDLTSDSLVHLDVSHCQLSYIAKGALDNLKKLVKLNLSWNHRLLLSWNSSPTKSTTLKELDISYCNMDHLSIEGFPNLVNLIARGNLIRQLTYESFANNTLLENINLSANAIAYVNGNTFEYLQDLRHLDLSWNVVPSLDNNTFSTNGQLRTINLSRNHFSILEPLIAPSVDYLDMSWCEILKIDKGALTSMPSLTDLDLSHNLINEIPDRLEAPRLRMLDLTLCRVTSLRNATLQGMPHLVRLLLAGNRFTTPFRESYFSKNHELSEMDLSDNPWRCDCNSEVFKAFYRYLGSKVGDLRTLKCETPEEVAGRTWSSACNAQWNPNAIPVSRTEKIWMFLMVTMLSFAGCMCVVMSVRRAILARTEAARAEELRVAEEIREREQQYRLRNEREAQRNAPDPRELVSPPCYEEALLMPRLDGSFASLGHLPSGSRENLRNKIKNRTQSEANILKPSPRPRTRRPAEIITQTTQSAVDIPAAESVESSESGGSRNSQESAVTAPEHIISIPAPSPARRPVPKTPPPKYKERHSDTSTESVNETPEPTQTRRVRHESDL